MSNEILRIPEETASLLKKTVSKLLSSICYDGIYSKASISALEKRSGIEYTNFDKKTSLTSKEIADTYCLLFTSNSIKMHSYSDLGLNIFLNIEWPHKSYTLGQDNVSTFGIDPAMLFISEIPGELVLSIKSSKSKIRVITAEQSNTTKNISTLDLSDTTKQLKEFELNKVPLRDLVVFKKEYYKYLRELFSLSGLSVSQWVTIIPTKDSIESIWNSGENVVSCLRDLIDNPNLQDFKNITLESIVLLKLSPATIKYLRWVFTSITEDQFESLELDSGNRGGLISYTIDSLKFNIQFSLEKDSYKSQPVEQSEALSYLSRYYKYNQIKSYKINTKELGLGLSNICDLLEGEESTVSFGLSKNNTLAFSGTGITKFSHISSLDTLISTLPLNSAVIIANLLKLYSVLKKEKLTELRPLCTDPGTSGINLGLGQYKQNYSIITKRYKESTIIYIPDLLGSAETDSSIIPKILSASSLLSCTTLKPYISSIPGVLGIEYGALLGVSDYVMFATGALRLLSRVTQSCTGIDEFYLIVNHSDILKAFTLLYQYITEESILHISILMKNSSKLYLQLSIFDKSRNLLGSVKLFNVKRIYKQEAQETLTRSINSLITTKESIILDTDKAESLKKLLLTCSSASTEGSYKFDYAYYTESSLWLTDKKVAVHIDSEIESDKNFPIARYIPDLESRIPGESIKLKLDSGGYEVSGSGTSHIVNNSYPTNVLEVVNLLKNLFDKVDSINEVSLLSGIIEGNLSLQRLLEVLPENQDRNDYLFWLFERYTGKYKFLKSDTIDQESAIANIIAWIPAEFNINYSAFSMEPELLRRCLLNINEYLKVRNKQETIIQFRITPTKLKLKGKYFELLLTTQQSEAYTKEVIRQYV